MHSMLHLERTQFMLSTPSLEGAPEDEGIEIAFAGRSNAGKSSLINALCSQKKLAVTAKTPGRTRQLVFFQCNVPEVKLVDLPGYGFAKASKADQKQWKQLIESYLMYRQSLRALVIICDVRHALRDLDEQMLAYASQLQLPVHLYFSKSDKLSGNERFRQRQLIEKQINKRQGIQYTIGSSLSKQGVDKLAQWIDGLRS